MKDQKLKKLAEAIRLCLIKTPSINKPGSCVTLHLTPDIPQSLFKAMNKVEDLDDWEVVLEVLLKGVISFNQLEKLDVVTQSSLDGSFGGWCESGFTINCKFGSISDYKMSSVSKMVDNILKGFDDEDDDEDENENPEGADQPDGGAGTGTPNEFPGEPEVTGLFVPDGDSGTQDDETTAGEGELHAGDADPGSDGVSEQPDDGDTNEVPDGGSEASDAVTQTQEPEPPPPEPKKAKPKPKQPSLTFPNADRKVGHASVALEDLSGDALIFAVTDLEIIDEPISETQKDFIDAQAVLGVVTDDYRTNDEWTNCFRATLKQAYREDNHIKWREDTVTCALPTDLFMSVQSDKKVYGKTKIFVAGTAITFVLNQRSIDDLCMAYGLTE